MNGDATSTALCRDVYLKVAFTGFKKIPILGVSHNSLSPRLQLCDEDFLHKVILTKRHSYTEVERVDITSGLGGRHLIVTFKDSIFTFSARLRDEGELREVVNHFRVRGVEITQAARDFLAGGLQSGS
jgi:hypothetical protein